VPEPFVFSQDEERQPARRSSRGTAKVLRSRNSLAASAVDPRAPMITTGEKTTGK
jgi:hypothetical protein